MRVSTCLWRLDCPSMCLNQAREPSLLPRLHEWFQTITTVSMSTQTRLWLLLLCLCLRSVTCTFPLFSVRRFFCPVFCPMLSEFFDPIFFKNKVFFCFAPVILACVRSWPRLHVRFRWEMTPIATRCTTGACCGPRQFDWPHASGLRPASNSIVRLPDLAPTSALPSSSCTEIVDQLDVKKPVSLLLIFRLCRVCS